MDNQRLFLYGALGLLILLIWQTWQVDYGPQSGSGQQAATAESGTRPAGSASTSSGGEGAGAPEDTPGTPITSSGNQGGGNNGQASAPVSAPKDDTLPHGKRVHVVTDLLDVTIDTHGADIRDASLIKYKHKVGRKQPVQLLSDAPGRMFIAQSGLQAGHAPAPTHHDTYTAERDQYRLSKGKDELRVPLTWTRGGVRVTKTFVFHRDSYVVNVDFDVSNGSGKSWTGRQYHQFQREPVPEGEKPPLIPAFFGAAYYSQADKYEKIAFDDLADENLQKTVQGGWTAMVDHYFLAACIPGSSENNTFYTKVLDKGSLPRYIIGLYSPARQVAPGANARFSTELFLGPKEKQRLEAAAQGLDLTIDYGYMTVLSAPLFWVLDHIHAFIGNWGWSIILLTMMIKLVFYKLSETSYKSMARMKKMQPKIKQLKERHGDDREKMGRAMMDLYKTEKINPLGGCLPIVVQIPVFIALYWMLLGSVELRHADFMLWINDLSSRDPYYVLPLLMGISMWAQQRLNPAPVDPIQQKLFMALPFVFTIFFSFFPAGLVLYWLTNNVLSGAQQYYITRYVVGDGGKEKSRSRSKAKS